MRRAPPVALLALAHAAGALPLHLGVRPPSALLLTTALLLPIPLWRRPTRVAGILAAALTGAVGALAHLEADARDCRRLVPDGAEVRVLGRLPAAPLDGRGILVPATHPATRDGGEAARGLAPGCGGEVALSVSAGAEEPPAGTVLEVTGRWRASPGARSAAWAGVLRVERWRAVAEPDGVSPTSVRLRLSARGTELLHEAFGPRGPLANALVLARAEGMDPELRAAFARSGIAHLLSISGFHVGVVAGFLFAVLRLARAGVGAAQAGAAMGVWGYVLLLGAPDPAVRAALLLSLMAGARHGGRPLAMEGALASAYLGMALLDAGAPGRAGFQLSFAGAAGLARIAPGVNASLARRAPRLTAGVRSVVSAGIGATLATLPIVAWHFESLSLVGIPGTIVAGPVVSAAIGGLLLVLVTAPVSGALASFLAGGTDLLLAALVEVVRWLSAPSWAAIAVPRPWVLAGGVGWAGAGLLLVGATGLGRASRHLVLAAGAVAAVLLTPLARSVADRGTVAIEALDVGQGDAILIRSPARRWVLVDAGPRSEGWDAGARVVVPALRARGVRRLEALVLTHPHLDHVGGAAAVLREVPVGVVIDPGQPFGTGGFIDALEAARGVGTPWMAVARGTVLDLDGMTLEVLHPSGAQIPPGGDPNDVSVVLLLRYGAFAALLTGDAPRSVEEGLARTTGPVHVLKVGHHGSETSSSTSFLAAARPQLALVSAGRGNRFGHPHAGAVDRLRLAGARVHRTDREGGLSVRALEDGRWTLSAEHSPD